MDIQFPSPPHFNPKLRKVVAYILYHSVLERKAPIEELSHLHHTNYATNHVGEWESVRCLHYCNELLHVVDVVVVVINVLVRSVAHSMILQWLL